MSPFAFISAHVLSQFSGVTAGYPITCQNLLSLTPILGQNCGCLLLTTVVVSPY